VVIGNEASASVKEALAVRGAALESAAGPPGNGLVREISSLVEGFSGTKLSVLALSAPGLDAGELEVS
jgi:hypothetical protein